MTKKQQNDRPSEPGYSPFPDVVPEDHEARLNAPRRLATLKASGLMDSLPNEAFERAVRLATRVTGARVGLVSIVDAERQSFNATAGLTVPEHLTSGTPLSHSFCQFVVSQDRALGVEDARSHPLLKDNKAPDDLNAIAYLGVPVHAPNGEVLGSFCAIEARPRAWTSADLGALEDLATMIETEIALRRSSDECQLLIDELNHRVKNVFAIVSAIIRLGKEKATSADDFAETLSARVQALARTQDLIVPVAESGSETRQATSVDELLVALLNPYVDPQDERVRLDGDLVELGAFATTNLALALHELATNAAKYGGLSTPDGWLSISWRLTDGSFELDWFETLPTALEMAVGEAGFGSKLLSICVEGQLQGSISTDATSCGWSRKIRIPRQILTD
jgi:two-component sensor histidine kinase